MTTHALMELAERFLSDYSDVLEAEFGAYDEAKEVREAATKLRTAAAEGGEPVAVVYKDGYPRWLVSWLESDNYSKPPVGTKLYLHPPTDSGAGRDGAVELLEGCRNLLNTLRTVSGTNGTKVYSCIESRGGSLVNVEGTIKELDTAIAGAAGEGS